MVKLTLAILVMMGSMAHALDRRYCYGKIKATYNGNPIKLEGFSFIDLYANIGGPDREALLVYTIDPKKVKGDTLEELCIADDDIGKEGSGSVQDALAYNACSTWRAPPGTQLKTSVELRNITSGRRILYSIVSQCTSKRGDYKIEIVSRRDLNTESRFVRIFPKVTEADKPAPAAEVDDGCDAQCEADTNSRGAD